MIEASSSTDHYMDELEEAVDRLITKSEQLAKENVELKQEIQILTDVIRDLELKIQGMKH